MDRATAIVEALVGVACLALAVPCWRRATALFRSHAVVLALAGLVAIANAARSLG